MEIKISKIGLEKNSMVLSATGIVNVKFIYEDNVQESIWFTKEKWDLLSSEISKDAPTIPQQAALQVEPQIAAAEKVCELYFNLLCEFLDEDEIRERVAAATSQCR